MIRKNKNYFDYYVWFKNIQNDRRKKVARINGRSIISYDEKFLEDMKSGFSGPLFPVEFGKHSYNVIDGSTGELVAVVDDHFNVFNNNNIYSCSMHNVTRLINFVTRITLAVIIIALIVIILLLKTTGDNVKTHDIYISESSGNTVNQQWNIFGETEEEKMIKPGKSGVYRFKIHNDNYFDIICNINFTEDNEYDIEMSYRLRQDKYTYLKGSSKNYLSVEDMTTNGIVIPAQSTVELELDWYWVEDPNNNVIDTTAGNDIDSYYTLFVVITGNEKRE